MKIIKHINENQNKNKVKLFGEIKEGDVFNMGGLICIKTNTYDALEIQDNEPIFLDLDNEVEVLDAEITIKN